MEKKQDSNESEKKQDSNESEKMQAVFCSDCKWATFNLNPKRKESHSCVHNKNIKKWHPIYRKESSVKELCSKLNEKNNCKWYRFGDNQLRDGK